MPAQTFDALIRGLSRRRAALGLFSTFGLGNLATDAGARKRKKKCKKKQCGLCRTCKKGKCKSQPDGAECGGGATCQGGQCLCPTECCADADCSNNQVCDSGQCVDEACPPGQKPCEDSCIPDDECCGDCAANEVCCTNVGECIDTRNDVDHCGNCTQGCPGTQFCANGACSRQCTTIGQVCFAPNCMCSNRVDPAHAGQNVCAEINPFTCDNVTTCSNDDTCGFQEVCVDTICAGKNVCAFPCA